MGSGGSKGHESFAVAPGTVITHDTTSAGEQILPEDILSHFHTLDELITTPPDDVSAAYTQLTTYTVAALTAISEHLSEDPDQAQHAFAHLRGLTTACLSQLTPQDLVTLAAAAGMPHPHLVGIGAVDADGHPLVHYLDPAYPAESPSKIAISAKADERYAMLAAGEQIACLTKADIDALEAGLAPHQPPPGGTVLPPGDVMTLAARISTICSQIHSEKHSSATAGLDQFDELLEAENTLYSASCPDATEPFLAARAAATGHINDIVAELSHVRLRKLLADTTLTGPAHAELVGATSQIALLRASTSDDIRNQHLSTIAARHEALDELSTAAAASIAATAATLSTDGTKDSVVALAAASKAAYLAKTTVNSWHMDTYDPQTQSRVPLPELPPAYTLSHSFAAWAKDQPLPVLRAAAEEIGLQHSSKATRAQVTKYLQGHWDPAHSQSAIQAKVYSKVSAPPKIPSSPTSATGVTTPVATSHTAQSWLAQHHSLVQALQHHQASVSSLTPRVDPGEVSTWTFSPAGNAAGEGGAHSKSYVTAPDGAKWLFKPDKSAAGARAHAEAAAAAIYHRVGIPSVDVHVTTVGAQQGSVQPLLPGVSQLSPHPADWTQADVDAMLRYHVAAWAVGDHDGGPANILRTSSGGLVPCDGGQAFKFYGRDTLDATYTPNASYGAPKPVFHQAYDAAKAHALAPGVTIRPEATAGVLAAFDALPDQQYRAMLHATAHEGAGKALHWVEPMRTAAAAKLGIPKSAVTTDQIAEQFLDHAVARKHSLRTDFAHFFTTVGISGTHKLLHLTRDEA